MRASSCFIVPTLILSLSSTAGAVMTYTPTFRSSDGNRFVCTAQNLSEAAVDVEATIDNGLGGSVGSMTVTIPPTETRVVMVSEDPIFGGHCEFEFDGDPELVRGTSSRETSLGGDSELSLLAQPIPDAGPPVEITLVTPPLNNDATGNFGCYLQNLSAGPVDVVAEVRDTTGAVLGDGTVTIPAGQSRQAAFKVGEAAYSYCTFRFTAPPGQVRGFATLQPMGGGDTRAIIQAQAVPSAAATATPTEPGGATATPTEIATAPTPTVTGGPAGCCGDCDLNGTVAINELITAVNNALQACP